MNTGQYGQTNYVIELDDEGHMVWPLRHKSDGKRMSTTTQQNWSAILVALADGPVEDKSGLAGKKLHGRYTRAYKRLHGKPAPFKEHSQLTPTLAQMDAVGLVRRDITGGKRTKLLALGIDREALPAEWFPSEEAEAATEAQEAPAESSAPTEPAEASEASEAQEAPALDLPWLPDLELAPVDYHALATALLQEAVAVISAPVVDEEKLAMQYAGLSAQLSNQHRITDALKRRVTQLEQELAVRTGHVKALRVELGESQRQLKQADSNVRLMATQMRSVQANFTLDDDQRAAIDRMMRQIPVAANGNGHGDD